MKTLHIIFFDSHLYRDVKEEYDNILNEFENMKEGESSLCLIYSYKDFNCKIDKMIKNELIKTVKEIKQLSF